MYTGYQLSESSRSKLLSLFPPKYPEVVCHHITEKFPGNVAPNQPESVEVIGYADDGERVEGLLVRVNGTINRPTGGVYHITLSIDRSKGAKPVHTNDVIKNATAVEPVALDVTPKVFA